MLQRAGWSFLHRNVSVHPTAHTTAPGMSKRKEDVFSETLMPQLTPNLTASMPLVPEHPPASAWKHQLSWGLYSMSQVPENTSNSGKQVQYQSATKLTHFATSKRSTQQGMPWRPALLDMEKAKLQDQKADLGVVGELGG